MADLYVSQPDWGFQYILSDSSQLYRALVTYQHASTSVTPFASVTDPSVNKVVFPGGGATDRGYRWASPPVLLPTFDTAASSRTLSNDSSLTFPHTCTTTNGILTVGFGMEGPGSDISTGVTYNGVAMTEVPSSFVNIGAANIKWYSLSSPAQGTHDVVLSAGTALFTLNGQSMSFSNVSSIGPAYINSANATSVSVVVPSATGRIVVGAVCSNVAFSSSTNTVAASTSNSAGIYSPGAMMTTMSGSGVSSAPIAISAFELIP